MALSAECSPPGQMEEKFANPLTCWDTVDDYEVKDQNPRKPRSTRTHRYLHPVPHPAGSM
jgi:hypothetical protein